ncbi:flagellar biosynthesis regulator FlaF [Rhizobium alvei]|jgi:flagellar protein FlaF|uniref:Flagellar biosynthesis regulator FlaF n=1 Tax=Rhizobium alvei TaxID=1132659 RepID=A0ABT8YFW5_9HYPH|nr:flagellar biosynthesis regulator FlaF [Rhizobium alvei]MDO6962580.1 flagellar biosynthesis regulator FlaF [Rhizobium alvei]
MYQFSYAEIMADDVADAKEREIQVLDKAIAMLHAAAGKGRDSSVAVEALFFTRRVWIAFIDDLRSPENQLPTDLRADLISIGIWVLKEIERIRLRKSENFQGIADIITIIRDGLK